MFISRLSLIVFALVAGSCSGEIVKVFLHIDPVTHQLYFEKPANEMQPIKVVDSGFELSKQEVKKSKSALEANFTKDGGKIVGFIQEKYKFTMKRIEDRGGSVEYAVTEKCLLDKECRQDVLYEAHYAVVHGVANDKKVKNQIE